MTREGFYIKNELLMAEELSVYNICKKIQTPFYLYSKSKIQSNFNILKNLFEEHILPTNPYLIAFSCKSLSNINILKIIASLGGGGDCVSMGEMYRLLKASIRPEKIVFAGVGKTKAEIEFAVNRGILQINVESFEELRLVNEVSKSFNKATNIAVRINPNIDAETHSHITTGKKGNKFGIDISDVERLKTELLDLKYVNFIGLSIHIGSQITSVEPLKMVFNSMLSLYNNFVESGFKIKTIDLGGGLGVSYNGEHVTSAIDYVAAIKDVFCGKISNDVTIIIEPGRFISASAGILVTSVVLVKETAHKKFAIVDAGMNDLIRPSLYGALHGIKNVKSSSNNLEKYEVVGPVCESACKFGSDVSLFALQSGDFLAIENAGAYGAVMSSNYNTRPLIKEVLVDYDALKIIRKEQTYEQIIESETPQDLSY